MAKAKVGIVPFAFGVPFSIWSNMTIARIAREKAQRWGYPICTQADIQVLPEYDVQVKYVEEHPGNPPPTLRICRAAVKWAQEDGIDTLWIVAAGPHLWRCKRDLKKAIREAGASIAVRAVEDVSNYTDKVWFCPDSTQPRTRTKKAWWSREIILRLIPFFIYKRLAG